VVETEEVVAEPPNWRGEQSRLKTASVGRLALLGDHLGYRMRVAIDTNGLLAKWGSPYRGLPGSESRAHRR
jgi:hypothetical protein